MGWFLLAFALMLGSGLTLGQAEAAEPTPLLPNLVADPPNNVTLETSTTEGGLKGKGEPMLLLRFNGYIHNVGPGALDFRGSRKSPSEAMKAFQRVYNSDGSFKEEPSAAELIYVTADGHEHWHLQRAAKYSLWSSTKVAEVAPAQKVGFCLDDSEHVEPAVGPKEAVYSDATGREFCRQHQPEATSLFEGVSAGWRDRYTSDLAFQWVDASNVLPGEYWLREDVNTTGVIKETGGANVPAYATAPTIIPGFDALAQSVKTQPEEARTLTLTSRAWNDSATPKYTIVSAPAHGTLEAGGKNDQPIYRPASGYSGPDSFTYSASDPNSPFPRSPSVATVSIEVANGEPPPEKGLLAGDATSTYAVADQTSAGREEAFQFTAKSTGTVEELQFRTGATANTGITGVVLGLFADNAGKPGEVLGHATASGEPATNTWIKATGLSAAVVSGTKYWLVALPLGGSGKKLHFKVAVTSGGTGNVESKAGGLSTLTAEASWDTYNEGPVGFQAIGSSAVQPSVTIEGAPASMTAGMSAQLTAHVTNDSPTVTWKASAGSITTGGLYTAPSEPPAGGKAVVSATTAKGAHDQRTIEIVPAATSGLLAGDATSTYAVPDQTSAGREETFQFTAKSTGTVEELQFRTGATANTGITGVVLGIFTDSAGKPGEVLGQATVSGEPATNTWIKATGLSAAVVSGTKYWLAALPLGGSANKLHFNAAVSSGGTGNVESKAGGLSALTPETAWDTYNEGPVGFQAIGHISGASAVHLASATTAAPTPPAATTAAQTPTAPTSSAKTQPSARPSVMIEGAPSSVVAGTGVQLSALIANDDRTVSWSASAGAISANGLYTAPLKSPAGSTVVVRVTGARGAHDERTITVDPVPTAQPAPAAPLPAASSSASPGVSAPQVVLVAGKLIMTTQASAAGQVGLSAYLGAKRLGGCTAVTPANRSFTCRLSLGTVSANAPIGVSATLRAGTRVLRSTRAAGPVPGMKMVAAGLGSTAWRFMCSPSALSASSAL